MVLPALNNILNAKLDAIIFVENYLVKDFRQQIFHAPTPPFHNFEHSHEQNSAHPIFMRFCEAWQTSLSLQIYSNNQLQMV